MSGHSKWNSIKHKKAATDAKRGKIFTKHAKLVQVAARGGSDPDMNPGLRSAIDNARAENMPMDNIEKAIKKGSGEDKDGAQIEEVMYEGYGPNGIALYIQALTDNRNRTVANIKHIASKKGGSIGEPGSVAYMFNKKGVINIPIGGDATADDIELAAIDAGAEDIESGDEMVQVYTAPSDLMAVKKQIEASGIKVETAEFTFLPQTEVAISEEESARKVLNLMEALEDDEDVTNVYSNFNIDDSLMEKVA
ncbi:YebC/PmpR family DNA-binding transcriptional regulator [Pseudomonadota bacterium]